MASLVSLFLLILGVFLFVVAPIFGHKVDLTVVPGTTGEDVVWAVLSKLDAANIFTSSDADLAGIFMRRLAYVETQDGMQTLNNSKPTNGGIWSVSQQIFQQTKSYSYASAESVYQLIHTRFGFDWKADVVYDDLSKPFFSGLAVRIYLDYLEKSVRERVPAQSGQASYWSTHFHIGASITIWDSAVSHLSIKEVCTVDTDVVFVLDSSGSIGDVDYQKIRDFTYNFTNALFQNSGEDRLGIVLFGDAAVVEKGLDSHMDKSDLLEFIEELPYFSENTATADGLCKLLTQPWRTEELVLKLAVVLTDGQSNRDSNICGTITQAANQVHNLDPPILVDAIGVGEAVQSELELIASGPDHVYYLDTYDVELTRTQEEQAYKFCWMVSQPLPVGHLSNGSSGAGEKTRMSLTVSLEVDITLRICVMKGRVIAYASTTISNPSSALYDWSAEVTATLETINCLTNFFSFKQESTAETSFVNKTANTLYVSVEGLDTKNEFLVNSTTGNETFDVNECEEHPYPCDINAACHNTDGSYYCVCNVGFSGDGVDCTDINECDQAHRYCDVNAICTNTVGGYHCTCVSGYEGDGKLCAKEAASDYNIYAIIGAGGGGGLLILLVVIIVIAACVYKKRRKKSTAHYNAIPLMKADELEPVEV